MHVRMNAIATKCANTERFKKKNKIIKKNEREINWL